MRFKSINKNMKTAMILFPKKAGTRTKIWVKERLSMTFGAPAKECIARSRCVYSTRSKPFGSTRAGLILEDRSGDWNFQMTREHRPVRLGYFQTWWRWEEQATQSKSRFPSACASSIVPGRGAVQLTDNKCRKQRCSICLLTIFHTED